MISIKRSIYFLVSFLLFTVSSSFTFANGFTTADNEPTILIHDTIAAPGELLLQLDALDFVGDNGQVAAITLRIEIDTNLIEFKGIQNMSIPGSWLANYNIFQNEITITFTAPYPNGYDINGKLLDLKLNYFGGFPADLHFKGNCDVSNSFLQEIEGVVYVDGTINQLTAVGTIKQDTVTTWLDETFQMPIMAEGEGYDVVNKINLRLEYDTLQLEYIGFDESVLTDVIIGDTNEIITIDWQDSDNPLNFTGLDTLLFLDFKFIGDTNTDIYFLPGSKVYNNNIIVATDFVDGYVRPNMLVEVLNSPDTAGTALGGGYYFPGDNVTLTSIPEDGFLFFNWTKNEIVVSTDSIYSFVKQSGYDTLTANYEPNSYNLILYSMPVEGGVTLGAGYYQYGEEATVTAIPNTDYSFGHWKFGDEIVSLDSIYTFSMPMYNTELVAVFLPDSLSVTTDVNNQEYGTAEGDGVYEYGATVTVIASPFDGFKFVVWTEQGQSVSLNEEYSFTISADRDLIANFQYDSECSAPVGLFADSVFETTATLYWVPSGNDTEWNLLWGETGFDTISGGILVEGLTETKYILENLDPGTGYDFYVKAVCTDELNSAWSNTFTFTTWFVGINALNIEDKIKIFPNPATSELKLVFNGDYSGNVSYRVINTLGVLQIENSFTKSDNLSINLNGLSSGIYILQILVDNTMITKVFLKN